MAVDPSVTAASGIVQGSLLFVSGKSTDKYPLPFWREKTFTILEGKEICNTRDQIEI